MTQLSMLFGMAHDRVVKVSRKGRKGFRRERKEHLVRLTIAVYQYRSYLLIKPRAHSSCIIPVFRKVAGKAEGYFRPALGVAAFNEG